MKTIYTRLFIYASLFLRSKLLSGTFHMYKIIGKTILDLNIQTLESILNSWS